MKYYTIYNGGLLIADTKQALKRFYNNVLPLPDDYEEGKYIVKDGILILNENWEEEQARKQESEFNKEFFNTSLGYIRRFVTMKDGSIKSFLTDILPLLQVGIPILTYDKELNQSKVVTTEGFINECKQQLLKDFYGDIL